MGVIPPKRWRETLNTANHHSHCVGNTARARDKIHMQTHRRAYAHTHTHGKTRTHPHTRTHTHIRTHTAAHRSLCIRSSQCKGDRWTSPPEAWRETLDAVNHHSHCEGNAPRARENNTHADAQTRICTHSHAHKHTRRRTHTQSRCCSPLPCRGCSQCKGDRWASSPKALESDAERCQLSPPAPRCEGDGAGVTPRPQRGATHNCC